MTTTSLLLPNHVRRFHYRLTWREIYELYRRTMPELPGRNLQARYNICPTTTIDAVIERDANRELVPMRWGPADQVPVNTPDSMMRWH